MSAAVGGLLSAAGGIGSIVFCIRATESSASFLVGSSFADAIRSEYVTSPASELLIGGSEWHAVHLAASTVWTSQGSEAPEGTGPEDEADDPLDDELEELPPELEPTSAPEELEPEDPLLLLLLLLAAVGLAPVMVGALPGVHMPRSFMARGEVPQAIPDG